MSPLSELFSEYARFYAERYLPYLIDEGFIDDPEDSEFAEAFEHIEPATETDAALPEGYRRLLAEVGHGAFHFPTEDGPLRLAVLSPAESETWRHGSLATALEHSELDAHRAAPFLVDDGGAVLAFVDGASDGAVYLASLVDQRVSGPIASVTDLFTAVFDNARTRQLPFEGML